MNDEVASRLSLIEARLRTLELGALRAADGLRGHEQRVSRLERLLRVRLHADRLEAAER